MQVPEAKEEEPLSAEYAPKQISLVKTRLTSDSIFAESMQYTTRTIEVLAEDLKKPQESVDVPSLPLPNPNDFINFEVLHTPDSSMLRQSRVLGLKELVPVLE